MAKGPYKNPTAYQRVYVLSLCWANDKMAAKEEIEKLKKVFEERFHYQFYTEYLGIGGRPQVQVNKIVGCFVADHDGPHTLLIVYYAGHGRPLTGCFGTLQIHNGYVCRDLGSRYLTFEGGHLKVPMLTVAMAIWTG